MQPSSHGLLLRLLLSSYFSVNLAISYLAAYADNIGVTWYIVRRLREVDPRELPWGMICHLLVTRPSKSAALETFVVDSATKHTHVALITLWIMQAYLRDERLTKNPRSFQRIQRVLHRVHEIIFTDLSNTAPTPYASLSVSAQVASVFGLRKIKPNAESVVVGLGMIAAAPALPSITESIGTIAIEQGRHEDGSELLRSYETTDVDVDDEDAPPVAVLNIPEEAEDLENSGFFPRAKVQKLSELLEVDGQGALSPRDSVRRRMTVTAAQTTPYLPSLALPLRQMANDPLGQQDNGPSSPTISTSTQYMSTPSIHIHTPPTAPSLPDKLLHNLLRSHYCRSEVDFILELESIANRLLVVPKPARVSALRAELTSLNHKLPAEVCLPLWCSSTDAVDPDSRKTSPHHRIVRIPPGESVVLNSAERAPYVLLVEVLNDGLSFDPTRRENKETLKQIIVKDSKGFTQTKKQSLDVAGWTNDNVVNAAARSALVSQSTSLEESPSSPITNSQETEPEDEEEVDLVEQLYGPGMSLRDEPADLSDTLVLPAPPRNKDLDIAAWSRSPSLPTTPQPGNSHSYSQSAGASPGITPRSVNFKHTRVTSSPVTTSMGDQQLPAARGGQPVLSLEEYSERMRTAAVMLAQLNATLVSHSPVPSQAAPPNETEAPSSGAWSWLPGTGWIRGTVDGATSRTPLQRVEAESIRNRIMQEMMTLEEERMERMKGGDAVTSGVSTSLAQAEDEGIIRRELNKLDPSATVFRENFSSKKARIRSTSPYGHLANWDVISVIVKTGADLRQEQLALVLIQELDSIWKEERCSCWLRPFKMLITGGSSGLVETITDAVSIHSIKKAEYARRLTDGGLGYVTLVDHFKNSYGDPSSAKYARAQRNFTKSLAGYSLVTYILQLRDRHNGNILLDTEGHCIHIDFGFMLGNSPGNVGVEAAPFKFTAEYLEVLGGIDSVHFKEFKRLFHEGFEAARKHCDRVISIVELMQKDSALPCFAPYGEQTAQHLRDRMQPSLKAITMPDHLDRLVMSSLGSAWTRLYDSFQYYSQSIL